MTLEEVVRIRRATRAFRPDPVPGETVEALLDLARMAPSGGNLQPWTVVALTGAPLRGLIDRVGERRAGGGRDAPDHPIYPTGLWEPLRGRRRAAGAQRYAALGLARGPESQALLEDMNLRFFDAPVGLFFLADWRCGPLQWSDLGMFMQTVMLAATARGLATCPQAVWAGWGRTVADHLGLDPDLALLAGMALGVPDEGAPLNALSPGREEVRNFTKILGFSDR
ncbi:MAG: nitroreductase [Rhodospirillum sp.]|nr:nitroreductase [Rhodospirillum sp.]MCF8489702.1 nitroreductase [Rhodospirillum sp.]MCF8501677.1 nitroreductase [Rhodospirillum sp.]